MSAAEITESGSQRITPAPAWAWIVGTFFGTGLLKPGPGTWASLATTLIWFALGRSLPVRVQIPVNLALAALVTVVGIPAATRIARAVGKKDPGIVVIDETAGQLLTFVGASLNWQCMLAGLILFRALDITKPFPIRRLEKLPEGTGIVVDDVGAGLYALAVMQLLLHFGILK
ncbi:MAG TPA: phosphatidylglycerophosphatase A [Terriglobales bacterium]|nr:phosphatidylglycerophosphatase A [Terriglobales bacterium]